VTTWTCHICKKERDDSKIEVYTKPLVVNGMEMGEQNVRYCIDDLKCIRGVKTYSFFKESKVDGK